MCLLLTSFMKLSAQQFFFKNYSVESGLPFVQVSCLSQDANGYLWGGGFGGLTRFDGKKFVNYNRKSGLVDQNVNALCTNDSNELFIGTNKGLSVLKGNSFSNYTNFVGLNNPFVTALCRGYHHSVYVGTTKGMFMFKDNAFRPLKRLENFVINCLYNPDTNVIFVGTNKGVVIYGHNTFKLIDRAQGLPTANVNCLSFYKNYLVIGTRMGLSFYDLKTEKITNYFIENGLVDNDIKSLCNQDNRYLWVGSQTGLLRFDGLRFDYYNTEQDNNSNYIRSILCDNEDNMWFGTHNGLFRYRDNTFTTYDKVSGLGNSFIYQVFRAKSGDLWVCSENNGIYRENQNFFKRYDSKSGLKSATSRAGMEDKDGRLIFGTLNDVVEFKNDAFVHLPIAKELAGPYDVIFQAADKTIWVGGSNGIASLKWKNGTAISNYYPIKSPIEFGVYGFCEDKEHNLYVGTFKAGLLKLENDTLINLSARLKLNEETFFTLRYINDKIFAASLNGLLVLDLKTGTLKRITDEEGLNSELIYSLEFAENKKALWIGTNQGINKLNLENYLKTGIADIVSFGKQEGFVGVECNVNGIWEETNGTLWFGTVSGLIKYQPASFKTNEIENKTLIQNIRLLNEDTVLSDNVKLPSNYNTISFYYRGICLTNPDKVKYQKKLDGLDKEWSAPGVEDYIKYTNLAPGAYTFRVRSCNNEGVWNKQETTFTFIIKTPFYSTWWFILLCVLIVFVGIYSIFKYRIRKIKRKQREDFERKVEMSRIELKALRSQMNPHFIFNSLNAIQHYIFNTKSDEAIKYLNKFARLVRIILNNSERPTVTVGDDIEALKLYLELEQMRFEEKFEYEITIAPNVDPDYDIMPPLLMQPYVENAILHGLNPKPVKGKLTIHLESKNNFLICTITDNGIGRDKAAEIRRTMPLKNYKSLGMKITEDRLKILNEINNSQLSVTITDLKDANNQALGTRVQLFVPLSG
ncbi:MAG: histidine kinase [Bacteroidia bacterium]|nr:histidine kinase [Bacteroidia bacterium]